MSNQKRVLLIINYTIVILAAILCIYPFYYLVIYSLSDPNLVTRGVYLFPKGFTLYSYEWVLGGSNIGPAFLVSGSKTLIHTMFCLAGSSLFAYLMTKTEMLGRKFVYRFVIITMYLDAGLIPWYMTMKSYHLYNNYWLYIIPGIINAYYIILIKTFIEQIPSSLEESAKIDGAGFLRVYRSIILPLSKPILATIAVYASVGAWICLMRTDS